MLRAAAAIVLLALSNIFMTTAWYGHLKWFPSAGRGALGIGVLAVAVLAWFIALPEYLLQVPANRLGHAGHGGVFTTPQLKVIQEALSLAVFAGFSIFVLGDRFRLSDALGFALVFLGCAVSIFGRALPA